MTTQFHSEFPLVHALEIPNPLVALRAIAHLASPFLLHSAAPDRRSRWSFFGAEPFAVFRGADYDEACALWRQIARAEQVADPSPTAVPFTGGAVGWWSYDFGRRLEVLPEIARDDLQLPDVQLGFYDVVGAFDHQSQQAWLFSSGLPLDGPLRASRAAQRLDRFLHLLAGGRRVAALLPAPSETLRLAECTMTPAAYRAAVERLKRAIAEGEIYQANLSQRWTVPLEQHDLLATSLALHESLAAVSPAPFAAVLASPDLAVVSSSPERFLELRGGQVETRPIKGTRPRGRDEAEDARLAAELVASAKDRAENVMIVDVLRNDLGRACETGSIEVPSLCELESFAQVHHLTSTVTGRLRTGLDAFDLLHACFPGGSITGAPKIRAMELLEGLEPVRRHVYTGAIGYLDWRGDADWNVAIRTALVTGDSVRFAAGGGITADSDPENEREETLHKAEGMRRGLERVLGPVALDAARVPAAPAAAPR